MARLQCSFTLFCGPQALVSKDSAASKQNFSGGGIYICMQAWRGISAVTGSGKSRGNVRIEIAGEMATFGAGADREFGGDWGEREEAYLRLLQGKDTFMAISLLQTGRGDNPSLCIATATLDVKLLSVGPIHTLWVPLSPNNPREEMKDSVTGPAVQVSTFDFATMPACR